MVAEGTKLFGTLDNTDLTEIKNEVDFRKNRLAYKKAISESDKDIYKRITGHEHPDPVVTDGTTNYLQALGDA